MRRQRRQREGGALEPIEVELPTDLLQDRHPWVLTQWVDWYRGGAGLAALGDW